jgi:hypothetical protein
MIENGDVAMDPIEGSDKGTIERTHRSWTLGATSRRQEACAGCRGGRCRLGSAGDQRHLGLYRLWRALKQPSPLSSKGPPTSGLCAEKDGFGCYSGAGGNDQFQATFGSGGVWNFFFQGCSALSTESVALAGIPGPNFANAYEPPPGYKCKMILHNGNNGAQIYDTGYVSNPIIGFADTVGRHIHHARPVPRWPEQGVCRDSVRSGLSRLQNQPDDGRSSRSTVPPPEVHPAATSMRLASGQAVAWTPWSAPVLLDERSTMILGLLDGEVTLGWLADEFSVAFDAPTGGSSSPI